MVSPLWLSALKALHHLMDQGRADCRLREAASYALHCKGYSKPRSLTAKRQASRRMKPSWILTLCGSRHVT